MNAQYLKESGSFAVAGSAMPVENSGCLYRRKLESGAPAAPDDVSVADTPRRILIKSARFFLEKM
jgi:hypothetical protein